MSPWRVRGVDPVDRSELRPWSGVWFVVVEGSGLVPGRGWIVV